MKTSGMMEYIEISVPHNPQMADVFYRSGEIESWGSGFDKIKLECDREAAPYPIIKANPKGGIELECDACELYMKLLKYGRYYDTYPQEIQETESSTTTSDDEVDTMSDGITLSGANRSPSEYCSLENQQSVDKMMEILSRELSDKEKILPIAEFLKTHDTITRQQAEKLTGKVASTVVRYLHRLVDLDVLIPEGQSVSTVYKRI